MSIRVACPNCGRGLQAPAGLAGGSAPCPACGQAVPVPAAGPTPPPPPREPPPPPFDPLSALADDAAASGSAKRISIAELRDDSTRPCPYCSEPIQADARKCKHCGEILDRRLRDQRLAETRPRKSPRLAALLSFLIPGAGQMYRERVLSGLVWFFVTGLGYLLFVIPGVVLHLLCIVTATMGDD